jgi:hemin uptake protein HemP
MHFPSSNSSKDDSRLREEGDAQAPKGVRRELTVVRSEDLFGPTRELWIEHDGCRYRLRITKRNKLILQK